ncbi:GntR family transcriptional regulator [Nocardia crassostreae]|uniref:GntR family transcriptional regulator n=1 Tax=Nocardia crassostreae TaxID=53428 RepID=UPI000A01F723|nr:GntR family transcriptional regulator [Nocardia crassostreae]
MAKRAARSAVPITADATEGVGGVLAAASARKLDRPAPLREAVYETLLDLIVTGALKPGQHLVETELVEALGVSRQPIREALQRLQTVGWVDLRRAQGAFVHTPTLEEATQLLQVRAVLETYSAQLAAEHSTPEGVEQLNALQQDGIDALAEGNVKRLVAANTALHKHITQMSGNAVLAELISQVELRVRWYYTPIAQPRGKDAWNEHARLIKAIAAGDAAKAGDIMRRHTEKTIETYRKQVAAEAEDR